MPMPKPAPDNWLKDQAQQRFNNACSDMLWALLNRYPKTYTDYDWDSMRREFQERMWELFLTYEDWRRL